MIQCLRGLLIDFDRVSQDVWSSLPCPDQNKKSWLVEQTKQEHLVQHALFDLAMTGPEAEDPVTYDDFANDICIASRIGDMSFSKRLAEQKQRHPTKDQGDRRLKYQLLYFWVPGCLWAFSTDGVAAFLDLDSRYPRSAGPYNGKTIPDARRDLKLYRSPKPLWWGVQRHPPSLVGLR
jgi:hypothetical protein